MRIATKIAIGAAGVIGLAASATAAPTSTLDLDIDIVEARTFAPDGVTPDFDTSFRTDATFGPRVGNFSGVVRLSEIVSSTTLLEVRIDGTSFTRAGGDLTAEVATLDGELTLDNGVVSGGFFEVNLDNGDAYVTNVIPDTGVLRIGLTGIGTIDGLTMSGIFTTTSGEFAGVPLGSFDTNDLFGSFLNIELDPKAADGFVDSQADLTLSAVIPLPTAAGLGLAGLSLLGLRRRRPTV